MSWSISEILKSFKNSQSVLSGLKPDNRNSSFFKQYIKILNKNAIFLDVFAGCFVSFKNERFKTRDFTITASSEYGGYKADFSHLYGIRGWCCSSASLPQYLQADFNQIVTVTGVATQGDAQRNNWVTSYLIRYGYDGKTWFSYGAGQVYCNMYSYIRLDLLKGTSRSFSPTFSFRAWLLYFFLCYNILSTQIL